MPTLPARTPVLVGAAALCQREEDPERALEPVDLMAEALRRAAADAGSEALLRRAAADAGSEALLSRADSIRVPRGMWPYRDPGRLVAERIGAERARSVLTELGILQTSLFGRALADIAAGREDVVLVTGGEAQDRARRARRSGLEAAHSTPGEAKPDEVVRPEGLIVNRAEIHAGLGSPVSQYALIENALRAADAQPLDAHRREVAELWAGLGRAAAENPAAWSTLPVDADEIREPGEENRMLAFPYNRLHCSQMNVDQAAALIFTSAETAERLGVPRERWIFPLAIVDSNHMTPLSERRALHRSPGFARAGTRLAEHLGTDLEAIPHREIYSCFPAAVRVQLRELALDPARPLSVTGGMAVAGGPLNNFVIQALARMSEVLRKHPGETGLVTAVSGLLSKQGVSAWSSRPGPRPFLFEDVGERAAADVATVEVVEEAEGKGRIATYTVMEDLERPRVVAIADLADGRRAVVNAMDAELARRGVREELIGLPIRVSGRSFESE